MVHIGTIHTVDWQKAGSHDWRLDEKTIDVWHIPAWKETAEPEKIISPQERERAARFYNKASRAQYITGRAALRYLSARYSGEVINSLVFENDESCKPCWKSPHNRFHFNLAHSGDSVLACFALSEVGADIEVLNKNFIYRDVVQKCFSAEETVAVHQSSNPHAAFYRCWTRKEALVKASGRGLHDELPDVPCLDGEHVYENWTVKSFEKENAIASIAYASTIRRLRFFELDKIP